MKVAVINFSGNIGKSTISKHLLSPRINNAIIIPVETINSDDSQDAAYKGRQFGELLDTLSLLDDAVVDIGASNVEDLVTLMKRQFKGSHEDFDYFVVPTVPAKKQQKDTIATIDELTDIGIPAKKIRVVFNMVDYDENPEQIFKGLFDYQATEKNFIIKKDAVIHNNEIYARIGETDQTIMGILNDPTDYKEKIKLTTDPNEKLHYSRLLSVKRLAAGVTDELDGVFKTLFK
jgi:hypothetical protein